jgi:GTP-binding protein HflX
MGDGRRAILTDTVGFIRRLPHDLVDAFRSTLEEAAQADLLVHVLDASDGQADRYYETTVGVLRELGAGKVPVIVALNKTDRLSAENREAVCALAQTRYPNSIAVSAKKGTGLDELKRRITEYAGAQ